MADARDFGTMVNRITREIRRDGLTVDIRHSIITAIENVEHRRFWFNEGEATATAATGAMTVSLPLAFIEADEVWYEDSASARWVLRRTHWEDLVDESVAQNGPPSRYDINYDTLHFRPPADKQYLLRISGIAELTELSASASSGANNAWTQEAEHLIRPLAKADLFLGRLRNPERAREQQALASIALQQLLQRTTQQISSGKLRKTQF